MKLYKEYNLINDKKVLIGLNVAGVFLILLFFVAFIFIGIWLNPDQLVIELGR